MGYNASLLFILSPFGLISQQIFSTMRFDQHLAAFTDLPLSFAIIYWSGAVNYLLLFSLFVFFFRHLSPFVLSLFLFMIWTHIVPP